MAVSTLESQCRAVHPPHVLPVGAWFARPGRLTEPPLERPHQKLLAHTGASATLPWLLAMAAARGLRGVTWADVAPPASGPGQSEAARLLTSSPGAAAPTSFHFAGEVVGANGSRVPVTDSPADRPARPRLSPWAAMVSP